MHDYDILNIEVSFSSVNNLTRFQFEILCKSRHIPLCLEKISEIITFSVLLAKIKDEILLYQQTPPRKNIEAIVPRGSLLVSLFFSIYRHDLTNSLECNVKLIVLYSFVFLAGFFNPCFFQYEHRSLKLENWGSPMEKCLLILVFPKKIKKSSFLGK